MIGMMSTRSVVRINPLYGIEKDNKPPKKRRMLWQIEDKDQRKKKKSRVEELDGADDLTFTLPTGRSLDRLGKTQRHLFDDRRSFGNNTWARRMSQYHTEQDPPDTGSPRHKRRGRIQPHQYSWDKTEFRSSDEEGFESIKGYIKTQKHSKFHFIRKLRKPRDRKSGNAANSNKADQNFPAIDLVKPNQTDGFDSVKDYRGTHNIFDIIKKQRQKSRDNHSVNTEQDSVIDQEPKPKLYLLVSCLVFWLCSPVFGGAAFYVAWLGFDKSIIPKERHRLRKISIGLNIAGIVTSTVIVIVVLAVYLTVIK